MGRLETSSSGFEVLEQAQIDASVQSEHLAFCDAHDLLAVVNTGNNSESAVTVYRLKGEVAFTIALRDDEDLRPCFLQWKPDGSLLAVNWSDEVCCLYSGENGKLLYELPTRRPVVGEDASWTLDVNVQDLRGDGADAAVASAEDGISSAPMMWTSYDDSGKNGNENGRNNNGITTDDFFEKMKDGFAKGAHPKRDSVISNLVNAITTLDTTSVLPRLSKIDTPTGMRHSSETNKFSTQVSTDTIFDASTFAPGIFSTLLTSDSNGCATVFVDETIKVGHIQLSSAQQVQSASRPQCPSQVILVRNVDDTGHYDLDFVDLPLEKLGSSLNYVVSLNTRRLQSLMAYITHTIRCIHQEIQTGIKGVPARLMKLLEEDLRTAAADSAPRHSSEQGSTDTATLELQHLALTSNFTPVVLEWLKDIVKETGHKRWEQATNAMYDHIQSYIFKNLLPALQRFVAAVSALRGQARFHQHTGNFAVRLEVFDALLTWADTLSLVAQRTLRVIVEEHVQFRAFGKWLRVMIDVAVAGPGSKSADETEEREAPNVDMDLCLRYIKGPLMGSLLKVLAESSPVGQQASIQKAEFFEHPVVRSMSRDNTVTQIQRLDDPRQQQGLQPRDKTDTAAHASDAINLPLLTCLLKAHTRIAIEEINQWQSQAVPQSPDTVSLQGMIRPGRVWDMAVYPPSSYPSAASDEDASDDAREIVHILASSNQPNGDPTLDLLSIARPKSKKVQPPSMQMERFVLPTSRPTNILHAALTNPNDILVLARTAQADAPPLDGEEGDYVLSSCTFFSTGERGGESIWHHRILHSWPNTNASSNSNSYSPAFLPSPAHFIVGGRPGKRVIVVFSPNRPGGRGTKWEVLDFESMGVGGGAEEEEDVEMSE